MINNLPKIEEFLEIIDPENKLDKKTVAAEILGITFLVSIKENLNKLPDGQKHNVENLISGPIPDLYNALVVFEKNNIQQQIKDSALKYANSLTLDYYKSHIATITESKKTILFKKFPALKDLSEE